MSVTTVSVRSQHNWRAGGDGSSASGDRVCRLLSPPLWHGPTPNRTGGAGLSPHGPQGQLLPEPLLRPSRPTAVESRAAVAWSILERADAMAEERLRGKGAQPGHGIPSSIRIRGSLAVLATSQKAAHRRRACSSALSPPHLACTPKRVRCDNPQIAKAPNVPTKRTASETLNKELSLFSFAVLTAPCAPSRRLRLPVPSDS